MDISLQIYSLREDAEVSFEHALEMTAKAGYQGVEFAGYHGNSPEALKALLDKYGLKAVSTHAGFDRFRDAFDDELRYAAALGYRLIVCPGISCRDRESIAADAKVLEACAAKAAQRGVTVGYHNHSHEFNEIDGAYALDLLLEYAPSVKLQPDVYWVAVAKVDPVAYITPLAKAGRICAVHAKELANSGEGNAYVGEGQIDFASIARLCPPGRIPYIVEQEEFQGDHLEGITRSYRGLKRVFDELGS